MLRLSSSQNSCILPSGDQTRRRTPDNCPCIRDFRMCRKRLWARFRMKSALRQALCRAGKRIAHMIRAYNPCPTYSRQWVLFRPCSSRVLRIQRVFCIQASFVTFLSPQKNGYGHFPAKAAPRTRQAAHRPTSSARSKTR